MHIPVLVKEVLEIFDPKPNRHFIDCTLGEGGHAKAILERTAPDGMLLGIDRDGMILEKARAALHEFGERIVLVSDTYANLAEIREMYQFPKAYGILFDLGISSWHLEESNAGFSFQRDEPLDMRFDRENIAGPTARDIVNRWPPQQLSDIFTIFGEERFAQHISHAIADARGRKEIETAKELADIIERAVPRQGGIHPATRVFQALRIIVNKELEMLEGVLPQAVETLEEGGKIIVISYHSLEDRVVKFFFRDAARSGGHRLLTPKPLTATQEEIRENLRSRSAKLRALQKT